MGFAERISGFVKDKGGSALMVVGVGLPALIGAAGLAVDTAQWYMWKRELQHAADQAALGGAWSIAKSGNYDTYELRAGQEFTANQDKVSGFSAEPAISLANYAGGTQNSVVVTATATRYLPFTGYFMGQGATIGVRAQAVFNEGSAYAACIISLTKEGTGTEIGGNADVRAQCGLAALSCDEHAITIDGSAQVLTDSIAACGKVDVPPENEDVVTEGVDGLEDIYADLQTPTNNTARKDDCSTTGTGKNKTTAANLLAGTYKGLVVKCKTTFAPGIYVIDGGVLDLAANYDVSGQGVMFVLKNGASMKFGGVGNSNSINLTPMQAGDLAGTSLAANADLYAGMLVYEDRNNNPGAQGHILNGNSNSLIEGKIYLPAGDITVNGTANVTSQCLMISAYRIKIKGGAFLETLCPEGIAAGSGAAKVRLIV